MTAFDSAMFAQARARVERDLVDLTALARDTGISPEEFLNRCLACVVDSLDAMGGAVWLVEDHRPRRIAELSFASSGYEIERQRSWIDKVLDHVVADAKPCIVAVQDSQHLASATIGNEVPHPFFYVPVVVDGRVSLILQTWLKQAGDPRTYGDVVALLDRFSQQAAVFLTSFTQAQLVRREAASRGRLKIQDDLLGELDPQSIFEAAVNQLVDLIPCSLAMVLRRVRGKWQLLSASNQETIDRRAAQSQSFAALAAETVPSEEGFFYPDPNRELSEGFRNAMVQAGFKAAAGCHFRSSKRASPSLLLLCLWHEPPLHYRAALESVVWCSQRISKALDAATLYQSIPFRRLLASFARVLRAWREDRRRRVLTLVVAPLLALTVVLLFPIPFKIKADCVVVPSELVAVVAEADGRVTEVLAGEGAQVSAGQILALQEDLEFITQLEVSRQQLARWQVEAARAQALGQEAERKLADLSARREQANIRRQEFLRSRTELKSPIDGVVLTKGVNHREGEALQKGQMFCEVGSVNDFELQLDLRQKDAGILLEALGRGESLPVDFILQAHSHKPLQGSLNGVEALSQLPELRATESVFTARLPISKSEGLSLRSGYTGKASIRVGRKPLGWLLIRPFYHFWSANLSL